MSQQAVEQVSFDFFSGLPVVVEAQDVQASSDHDVVSGTDSVSVTVSGSTGTRECPIHIRPEGYVVAPLPSGHIVR